VKKGSTFTAERPYVHCLILNGILNTNPRAGQPQKLCAIHYFASLRRYCSLIALFAAAVNMAFSVASFLQWTRR
jgi:hypothetical protein